MNNPVTLYLADDHQIILDGLKLLISGEETIKIIGTATNGAIAYTEIINKKPDIALLDLQMPGMDGMELVFKLAKAAPDTRIIILSMHDNLRVIRDAMNAGAAGYLLKNTGGTALLSCLSAVIKGAQYFPNLAKSKSVPNKPLFTPRETEIAKLILSGHTSGEIADQLCLSRHTVDVHRKNICHKTGTHTPLALKKFIEEHRIEL